MIRPSKPAGSVYKAAAIRQVRGIVRDNTTVGFVANLVLLILLIYLHQLATALIPMLAGGFVVIYYLRQHPAPDENPLLTLIGATQTVKYQAFAETGSAVFILTTLGLNLTYLWINKADIFATSIVGIICLAETGTGIYLLYLLQHRFKFG